MCACVCVYVCVCMHVHVRACMCACSVVSYSLGHHGLFASLPMEFSRQEYWSGLPFPSPGGLADPGMESASRMSPALVGRFFTIVPAGTPPINYDMWVF